MTGSSRCLVYRGRCPFGVLPATGVVRDALTCVAADGQRFGPVTTPTVTNNDLAFLVHFFMQPKRLVKLDLLLLHENEIGAAGCVALATAFRCEESDSLKSLGQLHLGQNPLGCMGVRQLMGPLGGGALPNLRELHMGKCGIGDKGAAAIGKAMEGVATNAFRKLTILALGQNNIADEGCKAIAEGLSASK